MRRQTWLMAAAVLSLAFLVGPGCSQQQKKERHLKRAEKYFAAAEYEKAAIEYRNVLRFEPTNNTVFLRMAQILLEQGLPLRALQLIQETQLRLDDLRLRLLQAEVRGAQGDRAGARAEVLEILSRDPTNTDALVFLVNSSVGAQAVAETEARLKQIEQQVGPAAPVQLAQAILMGQQGKTQESEALLQRVIQSSPNLPHAHAQMAQLHLSRTNLAAADQELALAARAAPLRSPFRVAHARAKAATGKLDEARAILMEIHKQAPDYVPAAMLLARVELQDKKPDAALLAVDRVVRLDPTGLEARELRSQIFLAQKRPDRAVQEWEDFDQRIRPNPVVKLHLARTYQRTGDSQKALLCLDQAIRLSSNRLDGVAMEARLLHARLALNLQNPAIVADELRTLLQRTNSIDARVLLIEAQRRNKRLDEALSTCRALIKDYPQNPSFPFLLGTLMRQQGSLNEARSAFRRSLDLSPGNLLSLYQLVDVEIAAADQDAALRLIQAEAVKRTNSPALKYLEGRVYASRRQWSEAEAALKNCIEIEPNFSGAYQMLANIYLANTNLAAAAREMESLVRKQPRQARGLMTLGTIYEAMEKYDLARGAYEKLLTTHPDFVPGLNNLAYLLGTRLNQLDKALELGQKAASVADDDAAVADTLGWIYHLRGEHQKGLPYLLQAAEKYPSQPTIQYHLGVTSYMLGQADTARAALKRAVAATEPFKERQDAQRYLAQLDSAAGGAGGEDLAALESRVKAQPKDLIARSLLAARYQRDGQAQKAAAEYEEVLKQNPRSAQAALRLAQLNDGLLQNPAKALEFARKARDLSPNDAETAALLGRLVYRNGDHTQAYGLLQSAARSLATQADVQFDAAWAAFAVGRVAEAEQAMKRALEAEPQFKKADAAKSFAAMAALCLNPAGLVQSQGQIEQLLKADPNHGPALLAQAALLRQKGQGQAAAAAYQKVLTQYPKCVVVARELALLYAADPAQAQKAHPLLVQARESYPDDVEVGRALGVLSYQRREYRYAATLLETVVRARPSDTEALFYLGMAQCQSRETAQGKANLQKAIAAGLKEPLLSEAKKTAESVK